jgi:hypothetical protein
MEGNDKKDELMDNIRNLIRRRRRKGESIDPKCELGMWSHLDDEDQSKNYSLSHLYLKFGIILPYLSHLLW